MGTIAETLAQARQLHEARELARAEALYQEILRDEPNHGEVLFLRGLVAQQENRLQEALDSIAAPCRNDRRTPICFINWG